MIQIFRTSGLTVLRSNWSGADMVSCLWHKMTCHLVHSNWGLPLPLLSSPWPSGQVDPGTNMWSGDGPAWSLEVFQVIRSCPHQNTINPSPEPTVRNGAINPGEVWNLEPLRRFPEWCTNARTVKTHIHNQFCLYSTGHVSFTWSQS